MRAVVVREVGGPDVLVVTERPDPRPAAGEVSIDVAYAGTGMVDVLFRRGRLPMTMPFTPGIEVTGRVREVGAGVEGLVTGMTVAALLNDFGRADRAGGYAQVAIAHASMTVPLGDDSDLPTVTGALVNGVTAQIALHHLARANELDTVVVLGASGGLGSLTARLAAVIPCQRVVGVVSRDRSRAPKQCTDVVLTEDFAAWAQSDDNHVDVVIDPVGGAVRAVAFEHLAPFGRHVILGNASGEDSMVSTDDAWHGTRTLTGLSLGAISHLRPQLVRTALESVVSLLGRGVLGEPAPNIQPLGNVRRVHQALEDRTGAAKTVLDLTR